MRAGLLHRGALQGGLAMRCMIVRICALPAMLPAAMLLATSLIGMPAQAQSVAFEGARVITGDGGVIADAAFVVENGRFGAVGRRGEVAIPAGAMRVDLQGKTVMPALIDLHGHIGFQNIAQATMSKETYTRENLIDHLQRLAYHGVGASVSIADLMSRSDLHGGRHEWGDVPQQVSREVVAGAALFRTAGPGIAWPGSGALGHPSRADVPYPVTSVEEGRAAVQDYVRGNPEFIKIWVDDRGGKAKKLTPPIYRAILEEAHKYNVPVAVHNVTLADAKELVRAGIEGWLHVPVRGGDVVDDEVLALVRDRVARNDRPMMWMTPSLITAWMRSFGGQQPDWLDDPLLKATYSPQHIRAHWGDPLLKISPDELAKIRKDFADDGRNAMRLRAAGIRIVTGTDTGQSRFWIGYFNHLDLESMVAIGMSPMEAIVAGTRDAAEIAHLNAGQVAAGRSADFIVLDANPLERIANTRRIAQVYLRGDEVPRAAMAATWQAQFSASAAR
jgi:imidazolonepropionase-like amidohydrolase